MTACTLTPRQMEACLLFADDLTLSQVALRMSISDRTVETFLRQARERMEVRSTQRLMFLLGKTVQR